MERPFAFYHDGTYFVLPDSDRLWRIDEKAVRFLRDFGFEHDRYGVSGKNDRPATDEMHFQG